MCLKMCTLISWMKYLTNTATHIIEQSDSGIYINYLVKHNGKDPQFKVGDHMRISKCFFKGIYSKLVRGSQTLFDQKSKKCCAWDMYYS